MKKIFYTLLLTILMTNSVFGAIFTGGVTKVDQQESNRVIDAQTNQGVEFAKISIPQKNIRTYTDANGNFTLPKIQINQPTILSVEKEGYRPFSVTINNNESLNTPMKITIAKSTPTDISLDSEIIHLGDDSYSKNSANAADFRLKSAGPYYSKDFIMTDNAKKSTNYLIIGSIVGLDTKLARTMGQNKIRTAYSSPAQVFFNGKIIGQLQINGDGQRIKIPNPLIIPNKRNQITIKTGQNMMPGNGLDYDDIEILNLSILSE
ncbi:MAG: carboxypeptidase-like regulatory domain-containing protein [Cyanobacteria bacterium SIG26]|nr:carboxypeptidase-like regulatory domain-containing protein [Cyanobacteria bacterium SIG26]